MSLSISGLIPGRQSEKGSWLRVIEPLSPGLKVKASRSYRETAHSCNWHPSCCPRPTGRSRAATQFRVVLEDEGIAGHAALDAVSDMATVRAAEGGDEARTKTAESHVPTLLTLAGRAGLGVRT